MTIGLILTELIINAQKYAYRGKPGPLRIAFEEDGAVFRMTVEDEGAGGHAAGKGFGSMMIQSLVGQLTARLTIATAPRPGGHGQGAHRPAGLIARGGV